MKRKTIILSLFFAAPAIVSSQQTHSAQASTNNCDEYQLLQNRIIQNNNVNNTTIMPSAFTPNDDGLNDVFRLPQEINKCATNFEIYNRWGKLIYKNSDLLYWDGRTFSGYNASAGSYFYTFELNNQSYRGTLALLR